MENTQGKMLRKSPEESFSKLISYLAMTKDPYKTAYTDFLNTVGMDNITKPGSINKHHSFIGGWFVHTAEVVENAYFLWVKLYCPEYVSKEEVIISALIHDLDKLICRYKVDTEEPTSKQLAYAKSLGVEKPELYSKSNLTKIIDKKLKGEDIDPVDYHGYIYDNSRPPMNDDGIVCLLCKKYNLPITEKILSAVSLHHGYISTLIKGSDRKIQLGPLHALTHAADILSGFYTNGYEPYSVKD